MAISTLVTAVRVEGLSWGFVFSLYTLHFYSFKILRTKRKRTKRKEKMNREKRKKKIVDYRLSKRKPGSESQEMLQTAEMVKILLKKNIRNLGLMIKN